VPSGRPTETGTQERVTRSKPHAFDGMTPCAAKGTPVIFVSGNRYDPYEAVPGSLFFAEPYRLAELLAACAQWRGH
jgi:hypothetical protein